MGDTLDEAFKRATDYLRTGDQTLEADASKISRVFDQDAANLFKNVDLFLNGQLLVSGSKVDNTAPTDGDYVLTQISATQFSGSFAFDLEVDDIITIIAR